MTRARFRCPFAVASFALLLSVLAPGTARAQAPRDAGFVADSMAAAGDSAGAVTMLEATLKRDKRNAAAWHQLGLITWNMAKEGRRPQFIKDQKVIKLLIVADSALRLATQFAPDSARFWLSLGKFNLTSNVSTMRFAAGGQAQHAVEAATRTGDSLQLAAALDEVGMSVWRRYEPVANRATTNTGMAVNLANVQRQHAADYVRSLAAKIQPPTGNADYQKALQQFESAEKADGTSQRYSRHLYMALAERSRWSELQELAKTRIAKYPLDFQAWQALGLASHRLGDDAKASVAFDSAEALMDEKERERMTQLSRILRPVPLKDKKGKDATNVTGDARTFQNLGERERRGLEAMYWLMADPLALTNENEHRIEFLSRVVYADFRFTNEDFNLRGADTDRGDIYVRYGPPVEQVTIGSSGDISTQLTTLVWFYGDGTVFFFDLVPGFGTARVQTDDREWVTRVKAARPVGWDNVASTRMIDTIPVRVARFRAAGDSVDAVVAASVPIDSLVRGLDMARVPVDVDFRLFDQFVKVRGIESVQSSIAPDSAKRPMARSWTRRLGPGVNVVRVEALQMDSKRAARAMTRVDPVASSGFGMSDVLLGSKPSLRAGVASPSRWSDVEMTPSAGTFAAGSAIGLLWEMYDIGVLGGQAKYRLAVTVDRVDRGGVSGLAARLVDGLGRTVGRQQSGRNNLTISFDRAVPSAARLVEFVSLDLSEASAGAYRLRVEVTDLSTMKKTASQTEFRIR